MDNGLIGKTVRVVNPTEEHRWLLHMQGTVLKLDEENYCYIVHFPLLDDPFARIRLVRGEFEEVIE